MEINLQVLNTILNYNLENKIVYFIKDFKKFFRDTDTEYGIFEIVAKRELKIEDNDKGFFDNIIFKLDSRGYNLIRKYKKILTIFIENDCFLEFAITPKNNLLKIINYIKNNNKNYILKVIRKLLYIGIDNIDFNEKYKFEEVYAIGRDETFSAIYSDCPKQWLRENNNTYYFKLNGAHYIIGCRNLKFQDGIIMKLNSFDFDINTLPSKAELINIDLNSIIDYKDVCLKTDVINNIEKIDETLKNIDNLLDLYNTLLIDFAESNKDIDKLKNKRNQILHIKQMLNELKMCIEKEKGEIEDKPIYKK